MRLILIVQSCNDNNSSGARGRGRSASRRRRHALNREDGIRRVRTAQVNAMYPIAGVTEVELPDGNP
jgi:hypothetical protein